MGIILFACQKADELTTEKGSRSDLTSANETGMFKLISDVVVEKGDVNKEGPSLRSRLGQGYEQSVPIYRYYHYDGVHRDQSDHYYGTEYRPNGFMLNGKKYILEPWWGFNIEKKGDYVYNPKFPLLSRYYSASMNDHALSTYGMSKEYDNGIDLGRIFTTPRLGTVPLWEFYSPVDKDHVYMWANKELFGFMKNPSTYIKKRVVGYVYPGKWVDKYKTANTFNISKLVSRPCHVTMKVNVREGEVDREVTYTYYFGGAGEADFTLPNTYVVNSVDMTISTYVHHKTHTRTLHLDATEMSYYEPIINNLKLYVNLHIYKDTYHKTSIEISFKDI